jgi:transposase
MWYAGIDWADQHHDIVVLNEQAKMVKSIRVQHNAQGLEQLDAFLQQISGPANKEQIACIIETNQGLLISMLLEKGWPVYPVNPRTVDRHRSPSGAKTDHIDAYLLARTGRADFVDLHRLVPDSQTIAELKQLTRDQDSLVQMQTRLVNQLTACLKAYYPIALDLFCKLQQRSSLLFLQSYPTLQAVQAASCEQIADGLRQARHPKPNATAKAIVQQVHQPQLVADAVTTRTKMRLMLALVAQLLPLLEQIATYDKEITALFLTHPDHEIFTSLPRAGKRLAPRLLAEIGDDRQRYRDAASLQALAGTAPVQFASGNYAKVHRRVGCIKPLRNALQQFAWQSTHSEAWALDYYQRKRAEGKSHTVAVRALANLWVRIIFAIWIKQQCYDPAVFERARLLHAKRAA